MEINISLNLAITQYGKIAFVKLPMALHLRVAASVNAM